MLYSAVIPGLGQLYNGNINEVVLQCCTAIYVENDIPILPPNNTFSYFSCRIS